MSDWWRKVPIWLPFTPIGPVSLLAHLMRCGQAWTSWALTVLRAQWISILSFRQRWLKSFWSRMPSWVKKTRRPSKWEGLLALKTRWWTIWVVTQAHMACHLTTVTLQHRALTKRIPSWRRMNHSRASQTSSLLSTSISNLMRRSIREKPSLIPRMHASQTFTAKSMT